MIVIVGLVVVIVGFTGGADQCSPVAREFRRIRLLRHRVDRHLVPVRDRRRRGGDAGSERVAGRARRTAGRGRDARHELKRSQRETVFLNQELTDGELLLMTNRRNGHD
jgi:hypothetical protein